MLGPSSVARPLAMMMRSPGASASLIRMLGWAATHREAGPAEGPEAEPDVEPALVAVEQPLVDAACLDVVDQGTASMSPATGPREPGGAGSH